MIQQSHFFISWDLFNTLLPLNPLNNSFCICLFLSTFFLSSLSHPSLPSSLLRWFRALSCCEGETGWWGERRRARERPSLSPRCSSHLPALPRWVVCVCLCVGQQASVALPVSNSVENLCCCFLFCLNPMTVTLIITSNIKHTEQSTLNIVCNKDCRWILRHMNRKFLFTCAHSCDATIEWRL